MPLMLNTPQAELPQRVLWDPLQATEAEEARAKIDALVQRGFEVKQLNSGEGEALLEPKPLSKERLLLRIMDETGDRRIVWDRNEPRQIEEVKLEFERCLAQGYKAYVCRMDGSRGRQMDSFDSLMEELIISGEMEGSIARRAHGLLVPKAVPG